MDNKTFTVQRSRWYRGRGYQNSLLRNVDGLQCCLGFVGEQCGIASDSLLNMVMPYHLPPEMYALYPKLHPYTVDWIDFSMVNDRGSLTEEQREQQLQELAKRAGFELVFVD